MGNHDMDWISISDIMTVIYLDEHGSRKAFYHWFGKSMVNWRLVLLNILI